MAERDRQLRQGSNCTAPSDEDISLKAFESSTLKEFSPESCVKPLRRSSLMSSDVPRTALRWGDIKFLLIVPAEGSFPHVASKALPTPWCYPPPK